LKTTGKGGGHVKKVNLGEVGRRGPGFFVEMRNKINGNNLVYGRQPETVEGDQEKEEDEGQRDVGLLKLAGRAIWLVIQDGIGVKKINEGDEDKKIEQMDKKNFPDARFFHKLQL
jgi:hypothetical protein